MELSWCNHDLCYEGIWDKVVGYHNHMELNCLTTGQVVYSWETRRLTMGGDKSSSSVVAVTSVIETVIMVSPPSLLAMLMLVKRDEDEIMVLAGEVIKRLMGMGVQVLVDLTLMGELANFNGINLKSPMIQLFYPRPVPGFCSSEQLFYSVTCSAIVDGGDGVADGQGGGPLPADLSEVDLIASRRWLHELLDPVIQGRISSCWQACW
jgi:hypothetical protein